MRRRWRRHRILDGARGAWRIDTLFTGEGIARNIRRAQPGHLTRGGLPLRYARDLAPARCRFCSSDGMPRSTGRYGEPPASPKGPKRFRRRRPGAKEAPGRQPLQRIPYGGRLIDAPRLRRRMRQSGRRRGFREELIGEKGRAQTCGCIASRATKRGAPSEGAEADHQALLIRGQGLARLMGFLLTVAQALREIPPFGVVGSSVGGPRR
jgi:hypothetical protein